MNVSEKIKTIDKKISKTKLNITNIDRLLRSRLYHQEMFVNMIF